MIDPIELKLTELYAKCQDNPNVAEGWDEMCNISDMRQLIEAVSTLTQRVIELERRDRDQSAVINELVGRVNE